MSKELRVVVCAFLLTLSGSVINRAVDTTFQLYAAPQVPFTDPDTAFIPAIGDGGVDLGIALSGGGSRAAFYSIGVLKGLYDQGYLQQADALSAVSGGGYTLAWLVSQSMAAQAAGGASRFGDGVFSDDQWRQRNSFVQTKSEVIPTFKTLLYALREQIALRDSYAYRVDRFARCSETLVEHCPDFASTPQLMSFQQAIHDGRLPFFQYNFAISTRSKQRLDNIARLHPGAVAESARDMVRLDGLVEASPFGFGNDVYGHHPWMAQDDMPLLKAVGISGAATRYMLPYQLPDYIFGRIAPATGITAYDGAGAELIGQGEKLGALALMRKHIPNIIIVDTELDPNYDFDAYKVLKRLARQVGINLSIQELDCSLGLDGCKSLAEYRFQPILNLPPVMIGTAEADVFPNQSPDGKIKMNIAYIKLSMSNQLFAYAPTQPAGARFCAASADYDALDDRNRNDRTTDSNGRRVLSRALIAKLGSEPISRGHYAAAVVDYANFVEKHWRWGALGYAHSEVSKFTSYQFPMITTLDQTFSPEESEALVGLGYLQAQLLNPYVKDKPMLFKPPGEQAMVCRKQRQGRPTEPLNDQSADQIRLTSPTS